MKRLSAYPLKGDKMKYRKIESHGALPGKNLTYQFIHITYTVISKGIAVFFCSTPIYLFYFKLQLFNIFFDTVAFVIRRVPFLFVGKSKMKPYHSNFCYGQAVLRKWSAVLFEPYLFYGFEKQPFVLSYLLFQWQTFIDRYP